jgi:hypothetical protein
MFFRLKLNFFTFLLAWLSFSNESCGLSGKKLNFLFEKLQSPTLSFKKKECQLLA